MTHVMNYTAAASLNSNNNLMEYMIEVITFDGESEIDYVEANSAEEAQAKAAAEVPDADYTMVHGSWVAYPVLPEARGASAWKPFLRFYRPLNCLVGLSALRLRLYDELLRLRLRRGRDVCAYLCRPAEHTLVSCFSYWCRSTADLRQFKGLLLWSC